MIKLIRLIFIINVVTIPLNTLFAQGCSDAGFCTMGAMRPNQHFAKKMNVTLKSIEISGYYGVTKFKDVYYSSIIDINVGINPKISFQVKLPYTFVVGELGKPQGFGDISLSATRNLWVGDRKQINLTLGFKLPTGNANAKDENNRSLPMYYQTTLGTYDFVIGISWISKAWLIAIGYQQALNKVENGFKWSDWKGDVSEASARAYPVSNQLLRGKDVMMRLERNFRLGRFNAYLGLLPIYRFTKDQLILPETKQLGEQEGSDGLALTGLVGGGYRFSYHSGIKFLYGHRIVERKSNPDGLSREQVLTFGYEYRF
jgi:hypothetical protein